MNPFPEIPDFPQTSYRKPRTGAKLEKKVKPKKLEKIITKIESNPIRCELWIDEREHGIKEILSKMNTQIKIVSKVMPIGDMAIVLYGESNDSNDSNESNDSKDSFRMLQLFERKSISDLLASIQDGRYKEQSYRMLGSVDLPTHNMVYIIEGSLQGIGADAKQRVYSAMTSIQFFKGMSVLRTGSKEETAETLVYMAEKVEREHRKGKSEASLQVGLEYVQHGAAHVKKDNITKENIGEIMLTCIPGVSAIYAKAIIGAYGSFPELVRQAANPDSIKKEIRGANGRRIPTNLVAKVLDMLS